MQIDEKDEILQYVRTLAELKEPEVPPDSTTTAVPEPEAVAPALPTQLADPSAEESDELSGTAQIGSVRLARALVRDPAQSSKAQVALRRLMSGRHLTIDYKDFLNGLLAKILYAAQNDVPFYLRLMDAMRRTGAADMPVSMVSADLTPPRAGESFDDER